MFAFMTRLHYTCSFETAYFVPSTIPLDLYRGHLISNSNMMFLIDRTENPILDLDISSWLLLAHVVGDIPLPSKQQMKEYNLKLLLDVLNDPMRRYYEENFRKRWWCVEDDHWSCDYSDKRMNRMLKNFLTTDLHILAKDGVDAKYPLQLGDYENLTENGKALVDINMIASYNRYDLDEESPDASWKTFRDGDPSNKIYSILTGTKAVPLKCRWLDIDGECKEDIIHT